MAKGTYADVVPMTIAARSKSQRPRSETCGNRQRTLHHGWLVSARGGAAGRGSIGGGTELTCGGWLPREVDRESNRC